MDQEPSASRRFVAAILPWLVAAGALAFYLFTLNRWVSLQNLRSVASNCGWLWGANLEDRPVFFLITYPLHWIPAKFVPLALNLFSAACATLNLALLARCVALLPHDRTPEQRQRETGPSSLLTGRGAWLPSLFAVLVCGLQLTFWEHATNGSAEMLDLLLFAYIVRCVLEYRVEERESWLIRAALVYGASMADSWAMIGFLPVFLVALVWIRGFHFFNIRFLTRMILCGLVGTAFYLLLPIINHFSEVPVGIWPSLKMALTSQRESLSQALSMASRTQDIHPLGFILLLSLTSILPLFVIGIRWPSYFGDTSPLGITLATWVFHLVHGIMLAACVWVAFDPAFGPRHIGLGLPLLTLYFLGGLSIGYLSGYVLLVFSPQPDGHTPEFLRLFYRFARVCLWLLLLGVPAGLIYKNLPSMRFTNGPALQTYASSLVKGLPEHALLLSDDATKLYLAQAELERDRRASDYILLNTRSLSSPYYHQFLEKTYPGRWPHLDQMAKDRIINNPTILRLIVGLSRSNATYYLHPSFGYYFEYFYAIPHGIIYELKPYPTNSLFAPPPTDVQITENEAFWNQADVQLLSPLSPLISETDPGRSQFRQWFMTKLHIPFEPNATARMLARFYSRSLDQWGVQIQDAGQWEKAANVFDKALELNSDNIPAEINLEFNKNKRAGRPVPVELSQSLEDRLGRYRNEQDVLNENGPFDEPSFCFQQGRAFVANGEYRQAVQEFERVRTLVPDDLPSRLWLARLYIIVKKPDLASPLIEEIRSHSDTFAEAGVNPADFVSLDAAGKFANHEPEQGEHLLNDAIAKNPHDARLLATALQLSLNYGRYTNAYAIVQKQLQLRPNDSSTLANKGFICIRMEKYEEAIAPLSLALDLQTNNYTALLDRAIAYYRCQKLDNARKDYEVLQKLFPKDFRIYYGLAEIAYHKQETNAAIQNYESYLSFASTNTEEAKYVSERLKSLKPSTP